MKRAFPYLLVLFFLLNLTVVSAQEKKDTLRVLLVGNSYTYYENLPQVISLLSEGTPCKLITRKSVAGGVTFKQHWLGEHKLETRKLITEGNFDIVVLQEQSLGAVNEPDSMAKYASLLCGLIRESGARPYFYVTWAREKVPQYQETIDEVYTRIARENKAGLIPVGDSWKAAREIRPGISLFASDGSHPSQLGSFLTACIFVKTLSGTLPENIGSVYQTNDQFGESILLMYIDPLDVVFCRKIAEGDPGL